MTISYDCFALLIPNAIALPHAPHRRRAIDDAKDFLDLALKDGPRPADELRGEAKARSIGTNALNNAKDALGVKAKREGGKDGGWFWIPPKSSVQ